MLNSIPAISGYILTELLHQNDSTIVYRGIKEADHQAIVVKLLQSEYPTAQEIERFKHEYEIARDLNLAGVVKPCDLINYKHGLALILDDFGGQSLKKFASANKLQLIDFLFLAIRIAEILGDLHSQNILHKDIKPQNIIYNPQTLQVKISDFSIATRAAKGDNMADNRGYLEGTLAYISPEQTGRTNRVIDCRADLYSLGVTFYEILTQQLPFAANDPLELIHCHIAKMPRSPQEINPEIPAAVAAIIMKLLAKNPEDRYQSACGLKADLEECLMHLHATGKIEIFPLGKQDKSGQFQIPACLYDREAAAAEFNAIWERVQTGSAEVLLLAGNSGTGKSAFANQICKPAVRQQAYFIAAKSAGRESYAPLIAAAREFILQLLGESQSSIQNWQAKLSAALGDRAALISNHIPELALLIGEQVPAQTSEPDSFKLALEQCWRVLISSDRPLVLFLDDWQQIDAPSLELINILMAAASDQPCLFLAAYRPAEVASASPLSLFIDELTLSGMKVSEIHLDNLDFNSVNQLIADTLHLTAKKTVPLANLVLNKTQGNPFFAVELLRSFYQNHWLTFNFRAGRWQWDSDEIAAAGDAADNVVEMAIAKIQQLPKSTHEILQLAACIGNQFDPSTLAKLGKQSIKSVKNELQAAIEADLIVELDNNYKFISDRARQAIYALMLPCRQQAVRWQIGKLLLKAAVGKAVSNNNLSGRNSIADIVEHLNFGIDLINSQPEKDELAQLNLLAATEAKFRQDYAAALSYCDRAIGLIAADSWSAHYQLTLDLYLTAIECEYIAGSSDRAEVLASMAATAAADKYDRLKVYSLQLRSYQNRGSDRQAMELGLASWQVLGIKLPSAAEVIDLSDAIAAATEMLNAGSNVEDIEAEAALNIFINLTIPASAVAPNLLPVMAAKMALLSIERRYLNLAALAFVWYGAMLCSQREFVAGCEFGNLALKLCDKVSDRRLKSQISLAFGSLISAWQQPLHCSLKWQENLADGDAIYRYRGAIWSFWQRLAISETINSLQQEWTTLINLAAPTNLTASLALTWQRQVLLNLQGLTSSQFSLSSEDFNELDALSILKDRNYSSKLNSYSLAKMVIFYLYENYGEAQAMAIACQQTLAAISSQWQLTWIYTYSALTLLALQPPEWEKELVVYQQQLKIWSDNCPENCLANYLLVAAETARVKGDRSLAEDFYDSAIAAAQQQHLWLMEALATELAAKFYWRLNKSKIAKAYLRDAHYLYLKWGAAAKVKDLEAKYPQLLAASNLEIDGSKRFSSTTVTTTSTTGAISGTLDWTTAVKASLAISSEIVLENLLQKLLEIALESAGAKTGCFILKQDNVWTIEVEAAIEDKEIKVLHSLPIEASNKVPVSIIYYADRTQQTLVLDDACSAETFASDSYILAHQPKSILCVPIIHKAQIVGILYLENNLTTGAFTSDRLEILQVLTSQVAISLENALLYQNLQTYSQQLEGKNAALQASETREKEKSAALESSLHQLQTTQAQLIQTEKISTLGQLVAGVAHEVNNPIGFIAGNLDYANDYVEDLISLLQLYQQNYPQPAADIQAKIDEIDLEYLLEDLPNTISSMRAGADRIKEIMSSLRNFSRADAGQKQLADINQGIDSTLTILRHRLKAKSERPAIQVVKQYSELPPIECYAGQLNQVFMNLIANAIDALEEYNSDRAYAEIERYPNIITIRTQIKELGEGRRSAIIGIADNGAGIPLTIQQQIFDSFFTTKPSGKGTGLGLSISYQIIAEKHGGKLSCISEPGQGAEFIIELPIEPMT